jgi:hypothetical protein
VIPQQQERGTVSVSEVEYREALMRSARIQKEADNLGPIYYEIRKEKMMRRKARKQRMYAFAARQVLNMRALLASTFRIRWLAERESAC